MIEYSCDVCTDRFIVSVEGHSGAAPEGYDIVCAAASALALTLVEAAKRFDEEGGVTHLFTSVSKGSVQLDITVKEDCFERAEAVIDSITAGFLLLEEHYPEYVSVS